MKKGFTLIELLAVIVILLLILSIAAPSLVKLLNSSRSKAYDTTVKSIEDAARYYVADYPEVTANILENGDEEHIYLEELCNYKYLECPIYNPDTEEEMKGYVLVTMSEDVFQYEYIDE